MKKQTPLRSLEGIVSCALLILSIGFDIPRTLAQPNQGVDPACSAPLRGTAVWAARAKAARLSRQQQGQALKTQALPETGLVLHWDSQSQLPELLLRGVPGQIARVDSRTAIGSASWQSLLTVNLGANPLDWTDFSAKSAPSRFYRITAFADNPPPEEVDDFLLLDHEGKARELFYPSNLKALVVATAGDSIAQLDALLAAIGPLAQSYSANEVQFWVLLHDPAAQRSDVAARVQSSGRTFPVLLDPQGWGALALRLTRAGEVAVIQPPTFTVMFRGQLDLSSGTPTLEPNLAAALVGVTQGKPFEFLRTPLTGSIIATAASGQTPSYSREVAPIFHQHCAICHQPNDVAPFAMTNYDTVAGWAPAIKHALLSGDMPPWHVDPSYSQWSNTLALPPAARSTLLRWVDAGAPRGDGPDPLSELPVPSSFRKWPDDLGPPDAIVTPGEQRVKLFGTEAYRYLFVQSPNPTSVWLRAAVILPSSPAIVHHYLVWPGRIGNLNTDPDVSTYSLSLAEYVPGVAPYIYPADSGFQLSRSNWLTFNLHYTPNGTITNDLPQLALWYHKTKPGKKYHLDGGFANDTFKIPPGAPEYAVQASVTLDHPIRVHRLNPHMHLRGKRMSFEVIYPNGTREMLLSVPDYDFRWQVGYQLSTPKTLPTGTQVLIKGAFDNSAQNLANPDPTASVIWGDQTTREMFVGFIDYVD